MKELQEKLNKSQSRVFRYLKEHGSITSLEAKKALNKHDIDMVLFFIHARDGFIEKRAVLSIDELRETL